MGSTEYFDAVASRWDGLRASFFPDTVREKAFSLAQLQPGRTAVGIGAGTGFVTEGLVRLGLKVIAIDQSGSMIDEMKSKFGNVPGIEYWPVDAGVIQISARVSILLAWGTKPREGEL